MSKADIWYDEGGDALELEWVGEDGDWSIGITSADDGEKVRMEFNQTDAREIGQKLIEMADQFDE